MSEPNRSASASPQPEIRLRAFAKINLTLDVFSKRPDGYHSIASVMQAISLCDVIHLSRRNEAGIGFTCSGPESEGVPADDSNLAVKAAKAALGGSSAGVAIHLEKYVPAQAGLGGGSSDAAATLIGVDRLLELNLSAERISEIAAGLGSDVPFFLKGGTAVARGRGEVLTACSESPPQWLVVVKPDSNVSTGWAYDELDADPARTSHRGTKRMEEAIEQRDADRIVARLCNDFELPVFSRYPEIAWLHDEIMMAGARSARLCGSGSAVFGVATSSDDASRMATALRARHRKVYTARTLGTTECAEFHGSPSTDGGAAC